jgi:hypothetical protein
MEMPATPAPVSSSSPQLPSQPAVSIPSAPSLGKAIHPSSSLGRTVLFAVIGILIILAILYFQGKLGPINPIKKIANLQLSTLFLIIRDFYLRLSAAICVLIN